MSRFEFSADGAWIVFQNEALFSLALTGSATPQLLAPVVDEFVRFEISADSTRVAYTAGAAVYCTPIDASGAPTQLCAPVAAPGWIGELAVSPDSTRVVYGVHDSQYGYIQRLLSGQRYIISVDGAPAGLLLLSGGGLIGRVSLIWVDPAVRKKGIGRAVMHEAAQLAQANGQLMLCAWVQREGMLRYFLAGAGFQEQLRVRMFVGE